MFKVHLRWMFVVIFIIWDANSLLLVQQLSYLYNLIVQISKILVHFDL